VSAGVSELTTLIELARRGDRPAVDRLYELLYGELRGIAHAKLRRSEGLTLLDTTGLVHESYLRLVHAGQLQITDRPHFLAYAARAMRSIVVDFARRQQALRRGGDHLQMTLDTAAANAAGSDDTEVEVLRVHEALDELAAIDERLVKVVEMRYFAGLDAKEIADSLNVSSRTVERDWEKARMYLFTFLK
jgi:RNA polymerase sigma factor (TIGR02999 family)